MSELSLLPAIEYVYIQFFAIICAMRGTSIRAWHGTVLYGLQGLLHTGRFVGSRGAEQGQCRAGTSTLLLICCFGPSQVAVIMTGVRRTYLYILQLFINLASIVSNIAAASHLIAATAAAGLWYNRK